MMTKIEFVSILKKIGFYEIKKFSGLKMVKYGDGNSEVYIPMDDFNDYILMDGEEYTYQQAIEKLHSHE